jgi:hypothetical protein
VDDVLVDMGDSKPSKRKKGRPDERFFKYAEQLREAVNRTDFRMQYSSLDWAREFETIDCDQQQLEKALTWFCDTIKEPYSLRIRSAATFRKRFGDILDTMGRAYAKRPTEVPANLLPETTAILDELRTVLWPPNGAVYQLPAVVDQSVRNHKAFVVGMKFPAIIPGTEWILKIMLDVASETIYYLTKWFMNVWKRHHDWAEWSGDMGPFVWTPDHKDFTNAVMREIQLRTGLEGVERIDTLLATTKEIKDGTGRRTS